MTHSPSLAAPAAHGRRTIPLSSKGSAAESASRSSPAAASRPSLYDEVTARIIGELEAGRVPWVQPWSTAQAMRFPDQAGGAPGPALPHNALTGRRYSGINVLVLWGAVIAGRHPSQGWLTFRQAIEAGGAVRKGERGTTVVYADRFLPKDGSKGRPTDRQSAALSGGTAPANGNDDARPIPFLKRFTVFNTAQCEGLRTGLAPDPLPLPECQIVPVAEAVIAASGVDFRIGGSRAFYAPGPDYVQVPPQPAFFEQVNYYRTCLHELTHATGHPARLGRTLCTTFGTRDYAREELVAEMGSAFLCASLGIEPTVRHADYLGAWLDVMREDSRAIFRAASAATKAADWLLDRYETHRAAGAAPANARLEQARPTPSQAREDRP